jgi:hypothetical protein
MPRPRRRSAKRKAEGLAPERAALRGTSAYLQHVAMNHPQVMCAMLSRIMPTQVQSEHQVTHVTYQTFDEIAARLRELGLEPKLSTSGSMRRPLRCCCGLPPG